MFKLIGSTQAVASRIIAANKEQFLSAARSYKRTEVRQVAVTLARMLRNVARSKNLVISTTIDDDGTSNVIEIVVDNLRRESMMNVKNNGRTGSGVDDIVKHFVMGWSWKGHGGGYWHGQKHGFRTRYPGSDFIAAVLNWARNAYPDLIITAPDGWER